MYSFRAIILLPLIIYVVFNYKFILKGVKKESRKSLFFKGTLFFYIFLHIRSTSLINTGAYVIWSNFIIYLTHISFWLIILNKIESKTEFHFVTNELIKGLLICFVIVAFIPMNYFGEFSIGGHYNLGDQFSKFTIPFISSTIEPPLLSTITITVGLFFIFTIKDRDQSDLPNFVIYLLFGLALLEILLINRRGPMLSLLSVIIIFYSRNYLSKIKFLYFFPLIVFIPLIWPIVIDYVLVFFENDFVKMFIARTDVENVMSATGRTYNWLVVLQYASLSQWNADYLFGIGNLPELEVLGHYGHAHNSILQLFVQTGLVGVILNSILIIMSVNSVQSIIFFKKDKRFLILLLLFFLIIALTPTESLFMAVFFTHILFINIILLLNKADIFTKELIIKNTD